MRIVGFAQTMRLDSSTAQEGYEIKLLLDSGIEATLPTSQETVMALTKLWAENRGTIPKIKAKPVQEVEDTQHDFPSPPVNDVEDDEDTAVFGGNGAVVADDLGYPLISPKAESMPRPRFLEGDDEDGNQV
jgi:hypothetical protein